MGHRRVVAVVIAAGLALSLAACSGGKRAPKTVAEEEPGLVNTGLSALAAGADPAPAQAAPPVASALQDRPRSRPAAQAKADWTQDPALDLQNLLKQLEEEKARQAARAAPAAPAEANPKAVPEATATAAAEPAQPVAAQPVPAEQAPAEPVSAAPAEAVQVAAEVPKATPEGTTPDPSAGAAAPSDAAAAVVTNPTPPPPPPLDERIARAGVALVDLLRQKSVEEPAPFRSYVGLAMLEALHPGAVQRIVNESTVSGTPLSAEEQRVIDALTAFGRGAHDLAGSVSSAELFRRLADMSRSVEDVLQMRVRSAALATRVISYGRFTPVPENRFVQGRAPRFLVYCEIEHFAYREIEPQQALEMSRRPETGVDAGDRWAVEVSQELRLFDAEGQQVWSLGEQAVTETSRNQRRDFFLTNDVTLPSTLGVGKYALKIIMRDKASGVTDEVILPIEIVADGVLAGVGG